MKFKKCNIKTINNIISEQNIKMKYKKFILKYYIKT